MLFDSLSETFIRNAVLIYGILCILISSLYIINLNFYAKLIFINPDNFTSDKLDKNVKKTLLRKYGNKMNYTHSHLFINDPLVYKRLQRIY